MFQYRLAPVYRNEHLTSHLARSGFSEVDLPLQARLKSSSKAARVSLSRLSIAFRVSTTHSARSYRIYSGPVALTRA